MPWTVKVRSGARVERRRFEELSDALEEIEARGRELARNAPRADAKVMVRRFEPAQQVVARIELSGPERFVANVVAGVDVRGDGSVESYTGRLRRKLIEQRKGETAYAALRRVLT